MEDEIRRLMESQGWDLCQGGLEVGFEFGRDRLEQDAIWARAQLLPSSWLDTYRVVPGRRGDAVREIARAVGEVRSAGRDDVRRMLPSDHPRALEGGSGQGGLCGPL